jgi:hypothetical protein
MMIMFCDVMGHGRTFIRREQNKRVKLTYDLQDKISMVTNIWLQL